MVSGAECFGTPPHTAYAGELGPVGFDPEEFKNDIDDYLE